MNSCRIHTMCHFGLSTHYFMSTVLTVSEPQIYVVHNSWHNGCRESAIVSSFMYNPALQFHCNFQFRHLWSSMDYLSWISTTPHLLELLWKWPCQLQIVFPTTPSYYFRRIFERQLTNLSFHLKDTSKDTSVISSHFWKGMQEVIKLRLFSQFY